MKASRLIFFILLYCSGVSAQQYEVNVHPGQELLTIIQVLAEKSPQPNQSQYYTAVQAHFSPFKDHPAVQLLKRIEGKIYSDFPELGWCYSDYPEFRLHLPTEIHWYQNYGKDTVQSYLKLAAQFAKDTDFWQFYQFHQGHFKIWAEEIEAEIKNGRLISILDDFYQSEPKPNFYIAMDPLNSWGAHAVPHIQEINPKFKHYKAYSVGFWNRESTPDDQPSFTEGDYLFNLIWHEGSHIYLDSYLKANQTGIQELAYLYNEKDQGMIRQNINTWKYCFEENLIRGIVLSLTGKHLSKRAYQKQQARDFLADFIYAKAISLWLDRHYLNKKKKDFGNALSRLIRYLGKKYPEMPYKNE